MSENIPRANLVVVEQVYHQAVDGEPVISEQRYTRWLASEEQPYVRRLKVGERRQALDVGWIKTAALLTLANQGEGSFGGGQPSPERKAELASRAVEVGQASSNLPFAIVRPGESLRFEPVDVLALWVRCQAGETRATVTLIPG